MEDKAKLLALFPGGELEIKGEYYPLSPLRAVVGSSLTYSGYAVLAFTIIGTSVLGALGMVEPPWLKKLREQRWPLLALFFLANTLGSSVRTSGAYEVTLNNELIFSKLKTGAVPAVGALAKEVARITSLQPDPGMAQQLGLNF